MNRHPINAAIRDAEAALFDLYAAEPKPGRIRAWLLDALRLTAATAATVAGFYALLFLMLIA